LFGGVVDATRAALEAQPVVQHLRKLQQQHDAASKQQKLAQGRIAELKGKRKALEIELPEHLAKKLQYFNGKLAEERQLLQEVEQGLTTLAPLFDKALAEAEEAVGPAFDSPYAAARKQSEQRRADVLRRIQEAIEPMLTELVASTPRHARQATCALMWCGRCVRTFASLLPRKPGGSFPLGRGPAV
jgi:septal ring factor EnvC (AmiA/AmiB activator)